MATAVLIMPLFFYGIRVLVPAMELAEPLMQDIDGLILPRHHVTVRICILMSDIFICTSHYYALLFIFICGLSLNVKLREQMERFRMAVENPREPTEETIIDDLILESQILHKYFENYGSIAGTYCFALIAYFTCYLIKAGSNLITEGARDAGTWIVKAETWAHWVLVAILLGILQLGSFISTSGNNYAGYSVVLRMPIRTNHSVNAHEVVGITSWKWKLTALTMFDVNRRLIPGVVATIMSYFIFMFQLKTAEITSPSSSLEP